MARITLATGRSPTSRWLNSGNGFAAPIYFGGVAGVAVLLVYEQSLVRADDLSQVKRAFDLNGYVGILYLLTTAIAIYVR